MILKCSQHECRWRRRKEARPEEILEAALELFAEKGFSSTRMLLKEPAYLKELCTSILIVKRKFFRN